MLSTQQYLIQLCQQLTEKGLQPSVGLLRSKSERSVSIQEIISVIQQWKQNPHKLTDDLSQQNNSSATKNINPDNLQQRVILLEQQVAILTAKLNQLEKG
ncbi:hypothetical protein [Neptunicella sp. SCSIO 80796]|uniref:hypothetical protein n=1 Tax=Neptunicella plasticusilytica TaxID=3117012 RepID=UPI003A4E14E6